MTERMKAVAAAGAVAAFWLAVWVLVAGLVAQPLILPGPSAVVVALLRLVCDGGTWAILAGSGARILGGLALAAVCGGVLAGISSRSRAFARLVAPALSFVKATPVACVVVLLLIWLGSARVSIAAVFLMALPGVYFSLAEGLTQVDQPLEQMFRLHGVRGWRLFCAHTWREVLPFVLSCARAVIGMSWKAGVAAELIGMATGTVGERIYQAKLLIETADLLSLKPIIYAANMDEAGFADHENNRYFRMVRDLAQKEGAQVLPICAKLEQDIAELEGEDRQMFLDELGIAESGLDRLIKCSYSLLGLISFLTYGKDECRAWTIKKGTKAPQAAGKIHTDIERGFIRAEVIAYDDMIKYGSVNAAREKGQLRSEGKEYVVQDGDMIYFRFNV